MGNHRQADNSLVQFFSREKLEEFKDMPLRAKLQWLEDANAFINKALGFERRAVFDKRFKGLKR
ncbi:MAG: hypothetical protein JSU90_03120 [Nitrospiraceae bacterium]|nr:MAG: hypothetical protein JSU90_03120 [Nitrospiraceae bacterium]